jgi:hypothetical protein
VYFTNRKNLKKDILQAFSDADIDEDDAVWDICMKQRAFGNYICYSFCDGKIVFGIMRRLVLLWDGKFICR